MIFEIRNDLALQYLTELYQTRSKVKDIIAELAERYPITIRNSRHPSSPENLVVRPYDHTTAQGATFSMRGQLYHGHFLSHYVMEGRGEGHAQAQLRA